MAWIKRTLLIMLSVSIILAGVPAQAKMQCPMAKAHQQMAMMDMGKASCEHCIKMTQGKQNKKGGCCGDLACAAKCLGLSGGASMLPYSAKTQLPQLALQSQLSFPADAMVASRHLNTQERPPKSIS